ncbi:Uncharacterised protein [Mycobacteroides abscessus subsp. abscessus]|nr:Uncharacterised protein [Mycobacteroides abscessus subsp. abscessus]SIL41554.1 Uncharacterised protein [Mycobacteroides abscessus subsp. abscessus]
MYSRDLWRRFLYILARARKELSPLNRTDPAVPRPICGHAPAMGPNTPLPKYITSKRPQYFQIRESAGIGC